jgi:adenylate cyclase
MPRPRPAYPDRISAWAGVAAWLLALVIGFTAPGAAMDRVAYDLGLAALPPSLDDSPIVIVAIDEPSFAELGQQWPWPRGVHAQLVDQLKAAGAAVIAFDVLFTEAATDPVQDRLLADALRRAGNVVLGADVALTQGAGYALYQQVDPIEVLRDASADTGRVGLDLDSDGVQRRMPADPASLALRIFERWGQAVPPMVSGDRVRYAGPPGSFRQVSYYQALTPATHLAADTFRDRIVLVGLAVRAAANVDRQGVDQLRTPFFRTSGRISAGIEAHAHIIDSLRRGDVVRVTPPMLQLTPYAIVALLTLVLGWRWTPLRGAALACASTIGLIAITTVLLSSGNIWLPLAGPCVGIWLAYTFQGGVAFMREQRQRRYIRHAFGKYMSDAVVEDLINHPEHLSLGGERRVITILMSDLAGFTTLTEALPAQTLVGVLQDYFSGMCATVLAHDGTITGMGGDSLMVLFNAPLKQDDHARRAIACAQALDAWSQNFAACQQLSAAFGPTRFGICTGEVTVGNFGGAHWFHYTAMGDAVNRAARLEGANKVFGTRICVCANTASACPDLAFRPIAEVVLKGKHEAVAVFAPVPPEYLTSPAGRLYEHAYGLLARLSPGARAAFDEALAASPDDPLARFHVGRINSGETGIRMTLTEK